MRTLNPSSKTARRRLRPDHTAGWDQWATQMARPLTSKRDLACRQGVSDLLATEEVVVRQLEGDLHLRAHDGYFFYHANGLLTVSTQRTFFVQRRKVGWFGLEWTNAEVDVDLGSTGVVRLDEWRSAFGIGAARFCVA